MKGKGLQIGNKVAHGDEIKTIVAQTQDYVLFYEDIKDEKYGSWIDLEFVCPIDLTEAILLKSGFVKSGAYFQLKKPWMFDEGDLIETCDFINFSFGFYGSKKIHYLHNFQNFVYILTGQELEVNP